MKFSSTLAIALAALLVSGCVIGGTGTDTDNGVASENSVTLKGIFARVVDGTGKPIPGVTLRLFQPDFRPDSGNLQASLVKDPIKVLISDSAGYVGIPLNAIGKFVVEGTLGTRILFFDTLAVPDLKASTLFTFRTRTAKGFMGKVKLVSGMRIDSGTVFIRGTARSGEVDSLGNYDLGTLPEDVGRMGIGLRFSASPVSVKEVTQINVAPTNPNTSVNVPISKTPTYDCKDIPLDSASRISAPAPRDSASEGSGSQTVSPLDTLRVNPALKSCDSLERGAVINVLPAQDVPVSNVEPASTAVLVLQNPTTESSVLYVKQANLIVVPYGECIPFAGVESTTYNLHIEASGTVSDIVIRDVAEKCLVR